MQILTFKDDQLKDVQSLQHRVWLQMMSPAHDGGTHIQDILALFFYNGKSPMLWMQFQPSNLIIFPVKYF